MNIPGFSAEASLYKNRGSYRGLPQCQSALPSNRIPTVEVALYAAQGRNSIIAALQPPKKGDPGLAYDLCMDKCTDQGTSYYQCRLKCAGPDPVPGTNESDGFWGFFAAALATIAMLFGGAAVDYCEKHPSECH
jgi:hypothetical protein